MAECKCKVEIVYPAVRCEDAPVPPALPVPNCECGIPAEVKQSRWPTTAARAYYMCSVKWEIHTVSAGRDTYYWTKPCMFFQWIDGPDKFDPRIRLFPYDKDETKPLNEFKRWVPPPPNPPPMTNEEKQAAACIRVENPPLCYCGHPCKLQHPNLELPKKFTPFFRCKLTTHVRFFSNCFELVSHDLIFNRVSLYCISFFHVGWMAFM